MRAARSEQSVAKCSTHATRSFPAFFIINHGMGSPIQALSIPRPTKNMQAMPMVRAATHSVPPHRHPQPYTKQAPSEESNMPPVRIKLSVLS